tara:strand:+ start:341 stop:922 length:582 start_codon:yes stop_codon:yes gene_type:complete
MKETTAVFNEQKDGYTPTAPGVYQSHIIELRSRELDDRVVFNFKVRVAEEAAKLDVPMYSKDGDAGEAQIVKNDVGKAVMVKADYMVGREFESRGVWFTSVPPPKERWRNRDYKEFCEKVGVVFPTDEANDTQLGEIEESDVLGLPLLAKIGTYEYKNKKTGKATKQTKVLSAFSWHDGKRLKPEELEIEAPF